MSSNPLYLAIRIGARVKGMGEGHQNNYSFMCQKLPKLTFIPSCAEEIQSVSLGIRIGARVKGMQNLLTLLCVKSCLNSPLSLHVLKRFSQCP